MRLSVVKSIVIARCLPLFFCIHFPKGALMASTENEDPPVVLAGLMKRLNVGSKIPPLTNAHEPSVLPVKQGFGDGATRPLSATTLRLLAQSRSPVLPQQPVGRNGGNTSIERNPMSTSSAPRSSLSIVVYFVLFVVLIAAGVFGTFYETPARNAAIQMASIEKSKQETLSSDQVELAKINLKIVKATGMAPQGFVSPPVVQAPQRLIQQPVRQVSQQPEVNGARGKIVLPLNKSFIASSDFTYEIDGNEPGKFAVVMYSPVELKSIEGEYMLMYGRDQAQKTEWIKSNGSIPEEVKKFLEAHRQPPGDAPIAIYTRGRVIINT